MTMRTDVRDRWAAALESGDYAQGRGCLTSLTVVDGDPTPRYCCLGVLCELAAADGVVIVDVNNGNRRYGATLSRNYLPPEVVRWAGLDGVDPTVDLENGETRLSFLNDTNTPFSVIATLVRERL
jgi:hypothetical protein